MDTMQMVDLRVVVNPFSAVDHLGRPSGAVLAIHLNPGGRDNPKHKDPTRRWAPRQYIGATVSSKRLSADRHVRIKNKSHTIPGKFDHTWSHSLDVVTLSLPEGSLWHQHYARAIRAGELLAADAETWKLADGLGQFQPPEVRLAEAKEGAIAQHIAAHHPARHAAFFFPAEGQKARPIETDFALGQDARLERLVASYPAVKQTHPVGKKLAGLMAAEEAKAIKAKADLEPKPNPTKGV